MSTASLVDYISAFLIGAIVAVGELTSRYKDDPVKAIYSVPAGVYIAVNGLASAGALAFAHIFGWNFGATDGQIRIIQVLVAGFGAIALFRSSLFNVTVADQVIGVGPSVLLNIILTAADRAVDRRRALDRSQTVVDIMKDVSFDKSAGSIQLFCIELLQNALPAEEERIAQTISTLRDSLNSDVPDQVKSYIFGLSLMGLVGEKVLRKSIEELRPTFGEPPGSAGPAGPGVTTR
jgi:hypothetical protein